MAKIKIFTTTTCPYCHMLMDYLKSKKIDFEEVNLDQHPEEIRTSLDTCGQMGVPCSHITKDDGEEVSILGFNKQHIDEALGL